jgi:hypothetical protein
MIKIIATLRDKFSNDLSCIHINLGVLGLPKIKSWFRHLSLCAKDFEAVRLAYLGISRLVLTYFLSQNTIHSTSRALFILPFLLSSTYVQQTVK